MSVIFFVVAGLVAAVVFFYFVTIYNGLILVKRNIEKAWANIDVLLKQRHDEVPKLIKVVEGYAVHERKIIDEVRRSREMLMSASGHPQEMGRAAGALDGALHRLFAWAENYPDLKAQAGFQQLQTRLSGLESDIADRREFYNESVNRFNIRIESFPDFLLANAMGLKPREMFQVSEADRQDVEIKFNL